MTRVLTVHVVESERRSEHDTANGNDNGNGSGSATLSRRDQFVAYRIESVITDNEEDQDRCDDNGGENLNGPGSNKQSRVEVWRRYNDFLSLHECLTDTYPYVIMPPLPEKRATSAAWHEKLIANDPFDPIFVDRRRLALELFLQRVLEHKLLSRDSLFSSFLNDDREWKQIATSSGYLKMISDQLKSWNASLRINNSDSRFDEALSYAKDLETHVTSFIRWRQQLSVLRRRRCVCHADMGRVLSEWAVGDTDSFGDALQRAGHHMDSFAADMPALLDDELPLLDRLHDLVQFTLSLQSMCHRYMLKRYRLEQLEHSVVTLSQRRNDAVQGRQGLVSRLMRSTGTEEVRELKVSQLDHQLADTEREVGLATAKLSEFVNRALEEVEHFKQVKVEEIRKVIKVIVELQIAICNKSAQSWSSFGSCMSSPFDNK